MFYYRCALRAPDHGHGVVVRTPAYCDGLDSRLREEEIGECCAGGGAVAVGELGGGVSKVLGGILRAWEWEKWEMLTSVIASGGNAWGGRLEREP